MVILLSYVLYVQVVGPLFNLSSVSLNIIFPLGSRRVCSFRIAYYYLFFLFWSFFGWPDFGLVTVSLLSSLTFQFHLWLFPSSISDQWMFLSCRKNRLSLWVSLLLVVNISVLDSSVFKLLISWFWQEVFTIVWSCPEWQCNTALK